MSKLLQQLAAVWREFTGPERDANRPVDPSLPSAADIDDGTPDGQWIRGYLRGLKLEEAEREFAENPYIFEGLDHMLPVGFRFYVPAAVKALAGPLLADAKSNGSCDAFYAMSSFAGSLNHWLDWQPEELKPVAGQLAAACGELRAAWNDVLEDNEIYRDVPARYTDLEAKLAALGAGSHPPPER